MGSGMSAVNDLLEELRQAGQRPDRSLLDRVMEHGKDSVRHLIEMAIDEKLPEADPNSPQVWAPLHAIELLGELGAEEAIEPLLPLFDRVEDSWLAEALSEAFGGIGAPAVASLRDLLSERTKDVWARVRAAEGLGKIGQRHPETRTDVVSTLVSRLDPSESQTPEDEILNAFVISVLLDLDAVEAVPAIRRAFDEDRVDTSIVDLDHALEELGLPRESRPDRLAEQHGLRLRLRCTACGYQRHHNIHAVYCDLPTHERRERGERTQYSQFVIPQRITCPKCGTVDQYELSGEAYLVLSVEVLKRIVAHKAGRADREPDNEDVIRFIRFGLSDGREIHPLAALEMYRHKVEAEPNRADLRVRYGNVLRFLAYRQEAIEQYRAALRLEPSNLEAYLNLGRLALAAGDPTEARRMFEQVLMEAPNSRLSRKTRESYVEAATRELPELPGLPERSGTSRLPARPDQREGPESRAQGITTVRGPTERSRKVGRNEPCPCGSGKKYKKCHGG